MGLPEFSNFFGLRETRVALQWLVIVLALGAGVAARYAARRRAGAQANDRLLPALALPLTTLLGVLAGRAILLLSQATHVLNVVVALVAALLIVRATVHALRYAVPSSRWLPSWERTIAIVAWVAIALHILGLSEPILEFLDTIALTVGRTHISVLSVLQAALSIGVALIVALWIARYTERRVMGAATVDINTRVMFAKLIRAVLMLVALLVALPAMGIDLTALSVFGGALGVGLGFGLQKVASNYVSGFIILADRSVKFGDTVTVDGRTGRVTEMTGRYIVVRSGDGTEAIIPNETVITSTVVNQSYSDTRVRAAVTVPVAYHTDVERALALMVQAAANWPHVMREPAPIATVKSYADTFIQLELNVWCDDADRSLDAVRSGLALEIWRRFRAETIELGAPRPIAAVVTTANQKP